MTIFQKLFWFFVASFVLVMVLPEPDVSTRTQEPVKYGKEEQCKTSKWYVRYWTYDGKPIAKDTVQCFNDLVIRTENL